MQNRRRASVRSQIILSGLMAIVGAALPALPATADDAAKPIPNAAPRAMPTQSSEIPTDQFIVKFKERAGIQSADRQNALGFAANAVDVPVEAVRSTGSGEVVLRTDRKLGPTEAEEFVSALASDPNVEYAEPDAIMRPFADVPNDPFFEAQWQLDSGYVASLQTWDLSRGEGSVVAVIDSGILDHSDLNANILPGYDMISSSAVARDGNGRDPDPHDRGDASAAGQCAASEPAYPSSWHGTHVAGIVAAVAGNGKGIVGVAPKTKVVPIRALGVCGGYASDIADSIIWAAGGNVSGVPLNTNPARVINLSLGAHAKCPANYQNAINFAQSRGAVVVVAAGNENIDTALVSPANCENVIVVGANTKRFERASYSNRGSAVDILAPGGDMTYTALDGILSTLNDGTTTPTTENYYFMQGTSMAAPHVAAVAGMMFAKLPSLTPAELEERLKVTANPVASCPVGCGAGNLSGLMAVTDVALANTPIKPETPYIAGLNVVGWTLSLDMNFWLPYHRIELSYQWTRNGAAIPGATAREYAVLPEDAGTSIAIVVTGKKLNTASASITSDPVLIESGSIGANLPEINGQPYAGNTLEANTGQWSPDPVELTYQWNRDGSPLAGATAAQYQLAPGDIGKALSVTVTGTKTGYHQLILTSAPTGKVFAADKAVTPAAVVFTEAPYMGLDTLSIPSSTGVEYSLNGTAIAAGKYPGRGQTKVTAKAKDGYLLLSNARSEWSTYFSTKGPDFTSPSASPFKDVLPSQQFYKEMSWLADRKISTGWVEADKSVTYRPVTPINRDAMAAFLYRMAGSPDFTPPATSPFKDVLTTQQFYKEMAWLAQAGISSGWNEPDGSRTYRPLTPINRDAMAAFLYRLANSPDFAAPPESPFKDVSLYQQFYKEMAWMAEKKISSGWLESDGSYTYRALSPINRDAMAAFLYRMP